VVKMEMLLPTTRCNHLPASPMMRVIVM